MKISLNWLKKYVKIPESLSNPDLISLIGSRLVEVEGVIDETHKYDNIYVVRVVKAEKIPDTHLTLCMIDTGGVKNELVQVLCGAPNVVEGMLAAWIAPGATVPASFNEDAPFIIGTKKMLGLYESNGMLAAEDELDFGEDHEGIIEINPEMAKPGDLLADVFELKDTILEIENKSLTHRPDCFGIIGFAREAAGILGLRFENPEFLSNETVFPDGFLKRGKHGIESIDNDIAVEIIDGSICPRYTAAKLKIIDIDKPEKYFSAIKVLLRKSGMNSISRIVDITNYLMLLTGQPLHAFDYDKFLMVGGTDFPKIGVRLAKEDEELELLDGEVVKCNINDILITSNDVPVALAGAMGGMSTAIDDNTKNVILESASFSLYNLRKTQMAHGIFSEAITRFTKGVPAGGTFNVLAEAVKEINGKPLAVVDYYVGARESETISVSVEEINSLLGTSYDEKLIIVTLGNVGISVSKKGDNLEIIPPFWRTDLHIKEDVIEEVGRLLGYDNIRPELPLHGTASLNNSFELKKNVRDYLCKFGANEVLSYSFVSESLLKKVGQDPLNSYKIVNSISPELQYVRQSIVPSLLEKAFINQKLPINRFAIFEMNRVIEKEWGMNEEGVPIERTHLGFVVAERKNQGTAFYMAKKYVAELLNKFGIVADFLPLKNKFAIASPFEMKRSAEILVNGELIGVVGEFKNSVRHGFKLESYLAGFEIGLDMVLAHANSKRQIDMAKRVHEDLTVTTDKTYADALKQVEAKYPEAIILPGVVYQAEDQETRNITFHIYK